MTIILILLIKFYIIEHLRIQINWVVIVAIKKCGFKIFTSRSQAIVCESLMKSISQKVLEDQTNILPDILKIFQLFSCQFKDSCLTLQEQASYKTSWY